MIISALSVSMVNHIRYGMSMKQPSWVDRLITL